MLNLYHPLPSHIEVKDRYGDERRSVIEHSAAEFTVEDMIPDEDMVLTISHQGYIKRTSLTEYASIDFSTANESISK